LDNALADFCPVGINSTIYQQGVNGILHFLGNANSSFFIKHNGLNHEIGSHHVPGGYDGV
jgi:hypothetical protein